MEGNLYKFHVTNEILSEKTESFVDTSLQH